MIKSIKNIMRQDREPYRIPRRVLDVIPIQTIWPDGIFRVGGSKGSGHTALLKEVNKSKRDFAFRMVKAVVVFCNAKAVVGSNKYLYNCVEGFQLSWEASASSR